MRKYYHAENASRIFKRDSLEIKFDLYEQFGGSWRGVYTTEEWPEIALLEQLKTDPRNAIVSIDRETYQSKSGKVTQEEKPEQPPAVKRRVELIRAKVQSEPEIGQPDHEPVIVHCVERHRQSSDEACQRVLKAFDSWVKLYSTGKVKPVHVWHYERDSGQLGDDRKLPFLKDILVAGMTKADHDEDIVMITNDDTILHPELPRKVIEMMRQVDAVSSFRLNINEEPDLSLEPSALALRHRSDLGRDMFAFRKWWLRELWYDIPDFILGEMQWDLILSVMIRDAARVNSTLANLPIQNPTVELPNGYVLHRMHERMWMHEKYSEAPAKEWNRELAIEWYVRNGHSDLITIRK